MAQFDNDRSHVIQRAMDAGLVAIVSLATKKDEFEAEIALSRKYPDYLWTSLGFHPHEAQGVEENDYSILEETIRKNPKQIIAVGEIGLDFYYNFSERKIQEDVLRNQIRLAKIVNLPVIIHCRNAYSEIIQLLHSEDVEWNRILFHCFSGSFKEALELIERGAYLAFGGTVTFKKNEKGQKIAASIPINQLFIETDSPYLTPVPYRGKRNEPSYVPFVYEKVAELKHIPVPELSKALYDNFHHFFHITA